ncbi:MAG: potassium-transporting ATPase subunit C [Planctomycetota bacterium]|nr:potassium-transporting ATPase subunit C [Planctomycetota bacterium]
MKAHLRANLWLLVLTVLLCSVLYPLALLGVGQLVFHDQSQGSLVMDAGGRPRGSRLIAQPFTADEYFWPRPSAVSYNATASGASNWAASNYLLRDRVARQLGPLVKYRSGPQAGRLVGPDIESWFQHDRFAGKPSIVAQWAALHPVVAQNWVKADPRNTAHVAEWRKTHPGEIAEWIKAHPGTTEPKPEDLATSFFTDYSHTHPGTFPCLIEQATSEGKTEQTLESATAGTDIQAGFFDMWMQEHGDLELEPVPADMVMASGSGLDPDITLSSALYQLPRVAAAWAKKTGSDEQQLRRQIDQWLRERIHAPLGGLVGVPLVNVLEINLVLRDRYERAASSDGLDRLAQALHATNSVEPRRPEPVTTGRAPPNTDSTASFPKL